MMLNRYNIIRNLALLVMLCDLVAWALPVPTMVWRVSFVLLSMSAFFFIPHERTAFEKVTVCFAFFNLLHFFVSVIWIDPTVPQIGSILFALLSLSLFAALAEKKVLTDRFLGVAVLMFCLACILTFYHHALEFVEGDAWTEGYDFTNNTAYNFVYLLPLLFLLRNRWQRWFTSIVCVSFLILGAKRGAILAAVIPLLLFVGQELKNGRHSVLKVVLVIIAVTVVSMLVYRMYMANEYLISRVESTLAGDSSGRDKLYVYAWRVWASSENPVNLLLGYGFDGTLTTSLHFRAHNDWLEILVDYGLLGVLFYAALFIAFIRQIAATREKKNRLVLFSGFTVWGLQSLYSMGFTSAPLAMLMMGFGAAIGRETASADDGEALPEACSWDMRWNGQLTFAHLDPDSIRVFMERLKVQGAEVPVSAEACLEKEGLCNAGGQPANAACLLFKNGEDPSTAIELSRYADAEGTEPETAVLSTANLIRQMEEVMAFVPDADYPEGVLREIIINMLVHRNYTSVNKSCVKVYPDRVECFNPGNLGRGKDNQPRNEQLAGMFCKAGYMEGKGEGLRRVKALCREHGLPDPQWKPVSDGVCVTLWKASGHVSELQLDVQELQLLQLLQQDGARTVPEIMQSLGLEDRLAFRETYLSPALSKGLVALAPSNYVQKYQLTVKGRQWLAEENRDNQS